jgi:hypothetical protein
MTLGIARLLLGDDAARVLDLFGPGDEEAGLAERARRSGEWCGSTPGRGSVAGALRAGRTPEGGSRAAAAEWARLLL